MAFKKKTWVDRMVEYAGRRKITNVTTMAAQIVDVERAEGVVSEEGTAINAVNMNDLEQRTADAFSAVQQDIEGINSDLGGLNFKEEAGKKYVRGADAVWVPLGNKNLVLMDGNDSYAYVGNSNGYYANFVLSNFDFSGFSKISIRNLSSYSYQVTCGPKVFTSDGTYDISDLDQAKLQVFYRGTNNNGNPPIQIRIELIP